jgi:ferritin-like metal-binding protein YciE
MDMPQPQEAFHTWLRDALTNALRALRSDDAHLDYLARSVDHADLKRRMQMHQLFR